MVAQRVAYRPEVPGRIADPASGLRATLVDLLADVADGKLAVEMVADPVKGMLAVISAAADVPRAVEEQINARMKAFPIAYRVQWMD